MKSITIVTAFFDIGREKFKDMPRSTQKYIDYFKRWARIQNDLIFYYENEALAQEVMKIRGEYGLADKTKCVNVGSIDEIEPEILKRMQEVEKNPYYLKFRKQKDATENNAYYDYIMVLKSYCLSLASHTCSTDYLVWLDFGFEHGGSTFENPEAYDFLWEYDFGDKINFFYLSPMDNRPLFEICRTINPTCLMGAPIVVPKEMCDKLWEYMKVCVNELLDFGIIDDDQVYELMIARKYPEIVELRASHWNRAIKEYGHPEFIIKKPKKFLPLRRFLGKIRNKIKKLFR